MIKLVFQKRKIGMNKTHLADGLRWELVALVLTELQIYQNFWMTSGSKHGWFHLQLSQVGVFTYLTI